MSAASDYDTALQAVATAISAGNYSTARTQLTLASVHALRLPQSTTGGEGVTTQERALSDLKALRMEIDELEQRTAGPYCIIEEHWVPGD